MIDSEIKRGDVFLVNLDPTLGGEIKKTRPCLIVSPDELNEALRTYIVAPLITGGHPYPFRLPCRFQGKEGFVVLDQIRALGPGDSSVVWVDFHPLSSTRFWLFFRKCSPFEGLIQLSNWFLLAGGVV